MLFWLRAIASLTEVFAPLSVSEAEQAPRMLNRGNFGGEQFLLQLFNIIFVIIRTRHRHCTERYVHFHKTFIS